MSCDLNSWHPVHMVSECEDLIQCRCTRTFQRWILALEIFQLISLLQHAVLYERECKPDHGCVNSKGLEKVKSCSPAKVIVQPQTQARALILSQSSTSPAKCCVGLRRLRCAPFGSKNHQCARRLASYVSWLGEDVTSSWKLADGGVEFPRYTSEHPLWHPAS